MKATLTFDLPEDRCAFERASRATDWALVAWDLAEWTRKHLKYNGDGLSEDKLAGIEMARNLLFALLDERGLSFDSIE